MPLKDNHYYKDNDGCSVLIVGRTRNYPNFVWSIDGNWYLRETGQFLFYNRKTGEHKPHGKPVPQDINMAIEPKPFDIAGEPEP